MKPVVNYKVLNRVLAALGTALVAFGEATPPGWNPMIGHIMQLFGALLMGKELLHRTGDIPIEALTKPPQSGDHGND